MKISVIMPSFLSDYNGAKKRDIKFLRAVNSYKKQDYINKELIVVSDGCEITNNLFDENFKNDMDIKLIKIPKQQLYSGNVRNVGLNEATGDIITYLDSDDIIGTKHLTTIINNFETEKELDWIYYDDYMVLNPEFNNFYKRIVEPRFGLIGTSSISHRKNNKITWKNKDGYGHDFMFIMSMNSKGLKFKKVDDTPQYIVCHYANGDF